MAESLRIHDLCDSPPVSTSDRTRDAAATLLRAAASLHMSRTNSSVHATPNRSTGSTSKRLPSINEVLGSTSRASSPPASSAPSSSHPYNPSSRKVPSSSAGHPCDRCGRVFTRRSDATKHIRVVHDRVKDFECNLCGRRFGRKDYLVKHKRALHDVHESPKTDRSKH